MLFRSCYLAGLLSNFGTLVVGHVFPPQYETICRMQEANPLVSHTHIDQHVLSVNREIIAATLLELWEVPDEVTTAIRFQWIPDYSGEHESYVHIVALAKALLAQPAKTPSELLAGAERLQISEDKLHSVRSTIESSMDDLGELAHSMGG